MFSNTLSTHRHPGVKLCSLRIATQADFLGSGPSHHASDFVQRFVRREARKKGRPKPLTAEKRARLREELREVEFLKPAYADESLPEVLDSPITILPSFQNIPLSN